MSQKIEFEEIVKKKLLFFYFLVNNYFIQNLPLHILQPICPTSFNAMYFEAIEGCYMTYFHLFKHTSLCSK